MKAIEYLKREREIKKHCADVAWGYYDKSIDEAIEEIEAYITNYQGINRRLDDKVTTLAVLQNENKALVKILTQINEEVLDTKD